MFRPRPPRDHQRGNSLLLALIVMSSLATLGSLTVVSVQSSLKSSTNERSQAIAMYAAESGAAAAMDYLRNRFEPTVGWNDEVNPNNQPLKLLGPPELPSSDALPGTPDNLFSADQNAWYRVELVNNRSDPGLELGNDLDGHIIIRSTGHGPQGSVAILEWEVRRTGLPQLNPLPPSPPYPPPPPTPPDPWTSVHVEKAGLVLVGWHVVL